MAVVVIVGLGVQPAVASTCVGDCRGNATVDIADLILGVNIALGLQPVADCEAFADPDGRVDVAQLIQGVNNALNGCPSPPTPSVTVPATPIPTVTPTRTPANTPTVTPTQSGGRFVDNADGTITDTQTGLIWEKKDQGGGLHDSNTRYPSAGICTDNGEFCQPDAAAATTCNAATGGAMGCAECGGTATCNPIIGSTTIWDWLNQLNAASFAGHSDWGIPTVGRDGGAVQLETIVDTSGSGCGSGVPCVPPAFDTGCVAGCMATDCSCTQAERYWSATSIVGDFLPFPSAWGVFFGTGEVQGMDKASAFYVRAVRGGS